MRLNQKNHQICLFVFFFFSYVVEKWPHVMKEAWNVSLFRSIISNGLWESTGDWKWMDLFYIWKHSREVLTLSVALYSMQHMHTQRDQTVFWDFFYGWRTKKNMKVHSFGSFFIGMLLLARFHGKWGVAESSSEVTAEWSEIFFF